MSVDPWISLGLLLFSTALTLLSNWMVGGFQRLALPRKLPHVILSAIASAIWILLVFAAAVIAMRYFERIGSAAIGYLAFIGVAFALSLVRARLFLRIERQQKLPVGAEPRPWVRTLVHQSAYLLFAAVLYLALAWLLHRPVGVLDVVLLCLGALLPDLDSEGSVLGRLLPFASRWIQRRLGHREKWHSMGVGLLIALLTLPLVWLVSLQTWYVIPLAFFSHLLLDLLTPQGVMLLWPLTGTRYSILDGPVKFPGSSPERRLASALAAATVILLLVVDIGPPPQPPVAAPSYGQMLERYYGMRGNNLLFASVEGAWQATGRRISGRFEILNAVGESYVMLDRYAYKVFTAGRSGEDNLYINSISLQAGSSATVKPVEVHLQNQLLADGMWVLYQMQREPGLQHIFVSGDLVMSVQPGGLNPSLQEDYAQTGLRKIQAHEPGHYRLQYLTASELINLADLKVEVADLVIVGTYISPATGPTVTPLPSLPPTAEPAP